MDSNVLIIADPEQIRRVINNIVGNSVKYMNKTQSYIDIRINDVGDFIQVEIEDNGRGINQRDMPYILTDLQSGCVEKFGYRRQRHRTFHRKEDYRGSRRQDMGYQQRG